MDLTFGLRFADGLFNPYPKLILLTACNICRRSSFSAMTSLYCRHIWKLLQIIFNFNLSLFYDTDAYANYVNNEAQSERPNPGS